MCFGIADIVETLESLAGLNERRNAAGETVGFGVTLPKLGREHIRQLDLTDLGLDLGIRHSGVKIVLKTFLAQKSYKKLLGEIGICVVFAFFNQKAGTL